MFNMDSSCTELQFSFFCLTDVMYPKWAEHVLTDPAPDLIILSF